MFGLRLIGFESVTRFVWAAHLGLLLGNFVSLPFVASVLVNEVALFSVVLKSANEGKVVPLLRQSRLLGSS